MITNVLLLVIAVILMIIALGLFSVGSKLSDAVSLLMTIQKETKKIQGCEGKLEIIMLNSMPKEK